MSPVTLRRKTLISLLASAVLSAPLTAQLIVPGLKPNLVCYYNFETPVDGNPALESDLGSSKTPLSLINGGAAMRNDDGAFPASNGSLETKQVNPTTDGNDDWKAGTFKTEGVASLASFSSATDITLMGWIKPTGTHPAPNSTTASSSDVYNAVGLFGVLSGASDGHNVRALVEIITVSNTLKLVALGRRIDGGNSLVLAANEAWQSLLPNDEWTHIAATFDFDNGTMELYRNGNPLEATYTRNGDPWNINGGAEPDKTSAASPSGIKIGGSFPQNTSEKNSFNGRMDDLMFFDRKLNAEEIKQQYELLLAASPPEPKLQIARDNNGLILSWTAPTSGYFLESCGELKIGTWQPIETGPLADNDSLIVPDEGDKGFYRLRKSLESDP